MNRLLGVVGDVRRHEHILEPQQGVIGDQMVRLAAAPPQRLGFAFGIALLLAIWSASSGVKALFAGLNVIAADTDAAAHAQFERTRRARVRNLFGRGDRRLTDDEVEAILRSPQGAYVEQMLTYCAMGTPPTVAAYLDEFQRRTGADELIVVHQADSVTARLRSVELLASAVDLTAAPDGS